MDSVPYFPYIFADEKLLSHVAGACIRFRCPSGIL